MRGWRFSVEGDSRGFMQQVEDSRFSPHFSKDLRFSKWDSWAQRDESSMPRANMVYHSFLYVFQLETLEKFWHC